MSKGRLSRRYGVIDGMGSNGMGSGSNGMGSANGMGSGLYGLLPKPYKPTKLPYRTDII